MAASAAFCATVRAQDSDADLAKQLSNPVAALISVPLQSNFDFRLGPLSEGWKYTLNFQPVIPVSLGKDWNLIIRTIVPYVHQEDVFKGSGPTFAQVIDGIPINLTGAQTHKLSNAFNKAVSARTPGDVQDGLGDIVQSFFFSPNAPGPGGIVWGLGPVFLYPSATDDLLGTEKWGAGPTVVLLKQDGPWTYGLLANHLWSFAGNADRSSVNATFLNPWLSYTTKTSTTLSVQTEATYDWGQRQWTVPVSAVVGQLVHLGKQPVDLSVGGKYYAEKSEGGPEWGMFFQATFLFPK